MGRKLGVQLSDVVAAAAAIADADGLESVTLTRVAQALEMRPPSLYNHVKGLDGLRRHLARHAVQALKAALQAAIQEADTPRTALRSMAYAYRRFAHDHPGLYAALVPVPTPEDDPALATAFRGPVDLVASWLDPVEKDDAALIHRIRAFRALLHGFVTLELNRGFGLPVHIDDSFAFVVKQALDALLATIEVP